MKNRFLGVLAFALLVSLGASYLVYQRVTSYLAQTAKASSKKILVAARDLPVGTLIQEQDLAASDWAGTISEAWLVKKEDIVGRGVTSTIYRGEPVANTRLAAAGAGAGLAATIPPGKRAVAVRVNEVIGVAGFVVPGMRVDVVISGQSPDQRQRDLGMQTRTILQNIEVLSAGQNIERDREGKPVQVQVVNLLVTPDQAEVLSLASSETRIQLVLRNPLDTEEVKTSGTATSLLFNDKPDKQRALAAVRPTPPRNAPPPPKPEPKVIVEKVAVPVTMEIISSGKKSETKVGETIETRVKEVKQ